MFLSRCGIASEVAWYFFPLACTCAFWREPDYRYVQLQPIPQYLTARLSSFQWISEVKDALCALMNSTSGGNLQSNINITWLGWQAWNKQLRYTRLVIGTSRTVGSAKKFVRITSGFGGGEFTKTLRKVCTCQILKFSFLLLEYCKIRECYAVANAFTIRNMYSLFLYMKCNSRKINRPMKNMTKIVTLLHF